MKNIFISYAHEDEKHKDDLVKHLHSLVLTKKIKIWQDGLIIYGKEWDDSIKKNLALADIVLLLVSKDSIVSDYINKVELKKAMSGRRSGGKIVIPIILKPCNWTILPISKIQGLPKHGLPVSKWGDEDEAFLNIVQGIESIV